MAHLAGRVAVITGASSGLGKQTAIEFAKRGAHLVLAARRSEELERTAAECALLGPPVLWVVTDVTQEDQVEALAEAALAPHGRIDIWINNAGVTLFAKLEDAPFDAHRRVVETNLIGAMLGARAVIPIFRRQRQGILINVGSILSKVGQPFVPSYVISKFGVQGLSETLRAELADEPEIHVCSIYPYAIDTPHFEAGANATGKPALAIPPVQAPEKVARAIADLAEHPRREVHVPRIAVLGLALHRLRPRTVERLLLHALRRWHFRDTDQPATRGNLYRPDERPGSVHGHRRPQIGAPHFALWVLGELVKIEWDALRERVRSQRSALFGP
jgi:NAD(P)-dependent dehydrogenase (short-subunit alcohol dehydrogenase family)